MATANNNRLNDSTQAQRIEAAHASMPHGLHMWAGVHSHITMDADLRIMFDSLLLAREAPRPARRFGYAIMGRRTVNE